MLLLKEQKIEKHVDNLAWFWKMFETNWKMFYYVENSDKAFVAPLEAVRWSHSRRRGSRGTTRSRRGPAASAPTRRARGSARRSWTGGPGGAVRSTFTTLVLSCIEDDPWEQSHQSRDKTLNHYGAVILKQVNYCMVCIIYFKKKLFIQKIFKKFSKKNDQF